MKQEVKKNTRHGMPKPLNLIIMFLGIFNGPEFLFVFLSLILISSGVIKWKRYNIHRALNIPKQAPHYLDDAYKSAKEVGLFLNKRKLVTGVDLCEKEIGKGVPYTKLSGIMNGRSMDLVYLMYIAHNLGCEVIIRQVSEENMEDNERFIQLVSRLNDNQRYNS